MCMICSLTPPLFQMLSQLEPVRGSPHRCVEEFARDSQKDLSLSPRTVQIAERGPD